MPALALGLSVAICHGIGRFAYALLMPAMKTGLGWSFDQASWINTANALGYVLGTLLGFMLLRWFSARLLFRVGILTTSASVMLLAAPLEFSWLIFLRVLSGVGAAWAFSTGGALVAARYANQPERKGAATALFFGAAGLGMIITGAMVPALLEYRGESAWAEAWLYLGLACAVLAPICMHESGRVKLDRLPSEKFQLRSLVPARIAMIGYFGFAAAHTGYIFFIFAWVKQQALPWQHGAGMWIVLGVSILFSFFLWGKVMSRLTGPRILAASCFAVAAGAALPLLNMTLATIYLSAFVVGSSLFIGPAGMAVLARQSLPQGSWPTGLMAFSVVFSIGQSLASWGFGRAADHYPLSVVLGVSSVGLFVASFICVLDKRSFSSTT